MRRSAMSIIMVGAACLGGCSVVDAEPVIHSTTAATKGGVTYIAGCGAGDFVAEPAVLSLTCQGNGIRLEGLIWQGWGGDTATARGWALAVNCETECKNIGSKGYGISVVATERQDNEALNLYRRLTVTASVPVPAGVNPIEVYVMPGLAELGWDEHADPIQEPTEPVDPTKLPEPTKLPIPPTITPSEEATP